MENAPAARPPVACLVSLGCDKNTVDSERLLARLAQDGFLIAERPEDADIALVNTCGFIAEARAESRRVLEALAAGRRRGRPSRIVALGCWVERRRGPGGAAEAEEIPADAAIGFSDYPRIAEICRALLAEETAAPPADSAAPGAGEAFHRGPRLRTGPPHIAALKISEGCSNRCRYCSIPLIRGPHASRPLEALVAEARDLIAAGAREILIVGQDTASYGRDLYGEYALPRLLRALAGLEGAARFRLMYAHPRHVTDELLDTLAGDPRLCPYLDLPLQHIHDRVLAAMGRGVTQRDLRLLLDRVRARWPAAGLRTTYIVGFPGETAEEFEELRRWVAEGAFLYAGVFAYSREPGTPAGALADDVPAAEKERRRAALMETQQTVTRERLRAWVGQEIEIMADGPAAGGAEAPRGVRVVGRAAWQAPDVDGAVYLRGRGRPPAPGALVRARIVESLDYDLVGEWSERENGPAAPPEFPGKHRGSS